MTNGIRNIAIKLKKFLFDWTILQELNLNDKVLAPNSRKNISITTSLSLKRSTKQKDANIDRFLSDTTTNGVLINLECILR